VWRYATGDDYRERVYERSEDRTLSLKTDSVVVGTGSADWAMRA